MDRNRESGRGRARREGISEVIGFLMILAAVIFVLSLYLLYLMPAMGREAEIAQMAGVKESFAGYKMNIDTLWTSRQCTTDFGPALTLGSGETGGLLGFFPFLAPVKSGAVLALNQRPENITISSDSYFLSSTGGYTESKAIPTYPSSANVMVNTTPSHLFVNLSTTDPLLERGILVDGPGWDVWLNITPTYTYTRRTNITTDQATGGLGSVIEWDEYLWNSTDITVSTYAGSSPVVRNLPVYRNIMGSTVYPVDLMNPAYGISTSFQDPQSLWFQKSDNVVSGTYLITYGFTSGVSSITLPLGSIEYRSNNFYYTPQNYYYQLGGVFLEQEDGSTVEIPPSISLSMVNTSPVVRIGQILVQGSVTESQVSGSGPITVTSAVTDIESSALKAGNNTRWVNVTIQAANQNVSAMWLRTFRELADRGGLPVTAYTNGTSGNYAFINITTNSKAYDVQLALTQVNVSADYVEEYSAGGISRSWRNVPGYAAPTPIPGGLNATTTTLGASTNTPNYGDPVTFTATVTGSIPEGTVTFYNGSVELGTRTLSSGVATLSYSALPVGIQFVTATYNGNSYYYTSTSSAIQITVSSSTLPPSCGTPAFVQAQGTNNLAGNQMSITLPGASTAGDLMVVSFSAQPTPLTVTSVTDSKGNTYNLAVGPTVWSVGGKSAWTYYATNIIGGGAATTITVTLTGSPTNADTYAAEYSGIATSSPLDQTSAQFGSGTTLDSGSQTTTQASEVIFGFGMSSSAVTADAPYTNRNTFDSNYIADQIVSSTGSYHVPATAPGGGQWVSHMATFKAACSATATWKDCTFTRRKSITIDKTKVVGTVSNFPVLINFTSDSDLKANARTNGFDIFFTKDDGTTKIPHQIEYYSPGTGGLTAWVKVDSLSSSANTSIYMYYGNSASANQANPTGVWDTGYKAVWHLNESGSGVAGEYKDSTSNGNHGTGGAGDPAKAPNQGYGKFGYGGDFVSTGSEFIQIPDTTGTLQISGPITIEAWMKGDTWTDPGGNYRSIIGRQYGTGVSDSYQMAVYADGSNPSTIFTFFTTGNLGAGTVSTNTWYFFAMNFTPAGTSTAYHHLNGAWTGSNPGIVISIDGNPVIIGGEENDATSQPTQLFDGIIDEVRLSNVARSFGWIWTEYNNQNSPTTFAYRMPQESGSCAPAFVQAAGSDSYVGNVGTITLPGPSTAGNLIVLGINIDSTSITVSSVTDSKSNMYTPALGPTDWQPTERSWTYYASNIAGGGGAITITVTYSSPPPTYSELYAAEYSGVATASPVDQTSAQFGDSATLDSGAKTTTQASELIFGFGMSAGTCTVDAPYTARNTLNNNFIADRTVSSTGSYHVTGTQVMNWWMCHMVTFKGK
jgi:hypothetical protein